MGSYGTLARRALLTDTPVMVQIQELTRGSKDYVSLAEGVVFWQPPQKALEKVQQLVWDPSVSRYGADEGLPELREALMKKLLNENRLCNSSVMVTAGANQVRRLFGSEIFYFVKSVRSMACHERQHQGF